MIILIHISMTSRIEHATIRIIKVTVWILRAMILTIVRLRVQISFRMPNCGRNWMILSKSRKMV